MIQWVAFQNARSNSPVSGARRTTMDILRHKQSYSHIKNTTDRSMYSQKLLYSTSSNPPHGGGAWRLQTSSG